MIWGIILVYIFFRLIYELLYILFWHQQIGPRAIVRHYNEQYSDLLQFTQTFKDRVCWAANLGSGKGTCPLCRISTQKLQSPTCGVLYQLTSLAGHTMHPPNFPVMAVLKRLWIAAFDAENMGVHHPALETRSKPPQPYNAETAATSRTDPQTSPNCLHICDKCHMSFLSAQGLMQHMTQAHSVSPSTDLSGSPQVNTSSSSTTIRGRPSKNSMTCSLAQVFRMPSTGPT